MVLYLPIRTTAHLQGLALSMPTALLSGSTILCWYLAIALKGMTDQC